MIPLRSRILLLTYTSESTGKPIDEQSVWDTVARINDAISHNRQYVFGKLITDRTLDGGQEVVVKYSLEVLSLEVQFVAGAFNLYAHIAPFISSHNEDAQLLEQHLQARTEHSKLEFLPVIEFTVHDGFVKFTNLNAVDWRVKETQPC